MGWRLDDMNCVKNGCKARTIAATVQSFSHEKTGVTAQAPGKEFKPRPDSKLYSVKKAGGRRALASVLSGD
jgi:hypothetical protein